MTKLRVSRPNGVVGLQTEPGASTASVSLLEPSEAPRSISEPESSPSVLPSSAHRRHVTATYRFQFHAGFTLRQAIERVPYLQELGVSHVYASPLFKAIPGSTHGYDVCDFSRLNPEIGTEADLEELVQSLHQRGMGLVLDIVPNHMGIAGKWNGWWQDVLRQGRASAFAGYFDIDWEAPDPDLRGKVLVPVLGDEYQRVLERGEIQLASGDGQLRLRYYEHEFPISPGTQPLPLAVDEAQLRAFNEDRSALGALLEQQHYRLAFWRQGDVRLNYRRFFSITTLAGVRVEDPTVFEAVHVRLRDWIDRGWLDGIRVDHPDGLHDPAQYLGRLRGLAPRAWIVVEKILEPGESLPPWPVAGTTGYDFLNRVNSLFLDPAGEKPLTEFYRRFTGEPVHYAEVLREKKRKVLRELLTAEIHRLVRLLVGIAAKRPDLSGLSVECMQEAIIELATAFPVYRTYVRVAEGKLEATDREWIRQATEAARAGRPDLGEVPFELLSGLLRLEWRGELEDEFVMRFQQLTGPAMAKGAEDTAFYCYHRLISLNEVGGDPGHFGLDVEAFHQTCQQQAETWPAAMLASSTHDTKRSEDVRARLNLLSEIPTPWADAVQRWSGINEKHHRNGLPDRNAEYLFYQTVVGAWPLPVERALAYMEKASCEAKQHTNWTRRNEDYDRALSEFIKAALADAEFIRDLEAFIEPLVWAGRVNSLAQTLLRLTTPGVPDLYQGTELWDLSLVDPDNRRPVDFHLREQLLRTLKEGTAQDFTSNCFECLKDAGDPGTAKLLVTSRTLEFRRRHPDLFQRGRYVPLEVTGLRRDHVCAFLRSLGSEQALVIAPRLIEGLSRATGGRPLGGEAWGDTRIHLPEVPTGDGFRDIFTGRMIRITDHTGRAGLTLAHVLGELPLALLEPQQ